MVTMEDLVVSRVGGVVVPARDARDGGDQLMTTTMTEPKLSTAAMVSMLNRRTGHARFRRGPVVAQQQQQQPTSGDTMSTAKAPCEGVSASASSSLPSSTTLTSVTAGGEGSVSGAYRALLPSATTTTGHAAGRLPVQSSDRARSENGAVGGKPHGGSCHCSSKRKPRVKKVIRVPAISSRNADIPTDDYSWRKYGQKPIKGSPYPRGYYKCSTVRGCPARKHVERDPAEPAMLIVTYEGDHQHDIAPDQGNSAAIITPP